MYERQRISLHVYNHALMSKARLVRRPFVGALNLSRRSFVRRSFDGPPCFLAYCSYSVLIKDINFAVILIYYMLSYMYIVYGRPICHMWYVRNKSRVGLGCCIGRISEAVGDVRR